MDESHILHLFIVIIPLSKKTVKSIYTLQQIYIKVSELELVPLPA